MNIYINLISFWDGGGVSGKEAHLGGVTIRRLHHRVSHRLEQYPSLRLCTTVPNRGGLCIGALLPVGSCIVLHHCLPMLLVGHMILQSIQWLLQCLQEMDSQWSTDNNAPFHPGCGSYNEVLCPSEVATIGHLVGLAESVSHFTADPVEFNLVNAVWVDRVRAELVPHDATHDCVLACLAGDDIKVLHTAWDEGEVLWLFKRPVSRN